MTATYTAQDAVRTTASEFSDADPPSATTINPLGEAAFDTAHYAALRVGSYRIEQVSDAYIDPDIGASKGSSAALDWDTGAVKIGEVTIAEGDIVRVSVGMHVACTPAAALVGYRLAYKLDGGAAVPIPAATLIYFRDLGAGEPARLTGQAWFGVGEAGAGALELFVQMKSAVGSTVSVASPLAPWIEVLRSNA